MDPVHMKQKTKPKHPIHRAAHTALRYVLKRKLLAGLSAALIAITGLAATDAYLGVKHAWARHEVKVANIAALPKLILDMEAMKAEVAEIEKYNNSDTWRWRRQEWVNTNAQAQINSLK
jgi:hypothetical protein